MRRGEHPTTKAAREFIVRHIDEDMNRVMEYAVKETGASKTTVWRVYNDIVKLRMRSLARRARVARENSEMICEEKYKGRKRHMFIFDDTKLFEVSR